MATCERTIAEILHAVATTEHVTDSLRRYPERDHAIEVLEDEVAIQRRMLVDDLRLRLRPAARSALRQVSHAR